MISSPPSPWYVSTKSVGLSNGSIWSYGTINLETRYIKRVGKSVQGLEPFVITKSGSIKSGTSTYPFSAKTKHFILIPSFSDDGVKVTRASAESTYTSTGQHLGIFKTVKDAEKYSLALDKRYKINALAYLKRGFSEEKSLSSLVPQFANEKSLSWYEGNIDLTNRPVYINDDKSISTVLSVIYEYEIDTVNDISEFVIVPTIVMRNGIATKLTLQAEIEAEYFTTGQHLGKYKFLNTSASAKKQALSLAKQAAKLISAQQDSYYNKFYSDKVITGSEAYKIWIPVEELVKQNLGPPPFAGIVRLSDLNDGEAQTTFQQSITNISVQWSMDLASQIVITVIDTDYRMMNSNYFVPRRLVEYRGRQYEIADVSCRAGQSGSPEVTITICQRVIQQMKRDKKRGSVKGNSGYEYARNVAIKYNLSFFGQKTAKTKSQFSAKSGDQEESVWTVLDRTASSNQFVCFIVDDVLIYAQHEYLMWKFGLVEALTKTSKGRAIRKYTPLLYIPGNDGDVSTFELETAGLMETPDLKYAPHIINKAGFRLETFPEFEASDNDPLAAQGSCKVLMPNGGQIRPGHTVLVGPQPSYFFGGYLVTSVSFNEGSPASVDVQFRTPLEPLNQNGKPLVNRVATSPARLVNRI
jgi:hypothetical protein